MNEHELPEDLRQWPHDPYQLLGVPRGVLPRDLKRAYTRLIRAFKPEHHPDHFKRLREAYETLHRHTLWFERVRMETAEEPPESQTPVIEATRTGTQISESGEAQSTAGRPHDESLSPPRRRIRSLEEELDEAWRWACDDEMAKAYACLRELHQRHPRQGAICLRLYWLLSLAPELDCGRSPCDWLTTGLAAAGLTGPLRELYGRELEAAPLEAMSDRCTRLLDVPASTCALADLVELRWRAAVKSAGGPLTIAADLQRLRPLVRADDEDAWTRLLLSAIDLVAWIREPAAAQVLAGCKLEIDELRHLHLKHVVALDRLELLMEMSVGWRTLCDGRLLPTEFLQLIPLSWMQSFDSLRPALTAYLAQVAERPGQTLWTFQLIQRQAPTVLFQFRRLLDWLEEAIEPPPDARDDAELWKVVMQFAQDTPSSNYDSWRANFFLDFCLRESISPEQARAAIPEGDVPLRSPRNLFEMAADDAPLACVCQACRLFWA